MRNRPGTLLGSWVVSACAKDDCLLKESVVVAKNWLSLVC